MSSFENNNDLSNENINEIEVENLIKNLNLVNFFQNNTPFDLFDILKNSESPSKQILKILLNSGSKKLYDNYISSKLKNFTTKINFDFICFIMDFQHKIKDDENSNFFEDIETVNIIRKNILYLLIH